MGGYTTKALDQRKLEIRLPLPMRISKGTIFVLTLVNNVHIQIIQVVSEPLCASRD